MGGQHGAGGTVTYTCCDSPTRLSRKCLREKAIDEHRSSSTRSSRVHEESDLYRGVLFVTTLIFSREGACCFYSSLDEIHFIPGSQLREGKDMLEVDMSRTRRLSQEKG